MTGTIDLEREGFRRWHWKARGPLHVTTTRTLLPNGDALIVESGPTALAGAGVARSHRQAKRRALAALRSPTR
jgi:hypothetical protein